MKTVLEEIQYILLHYTAIEYANMMLKREKEASTLTVWDKGNVYQKKVPYEKFMQETWGTGNMTMKALIERSKDAKLNQYAGYIDLLTGFNKSGKVFVLNKKEKVVSFLYGEYNNNEDKKFAKLHVHYNPLNVEYIFQHISSDYLFKNMENEEYDMSQMEGHIIKECDSLIGIRV